VRTSPPGILPVIVIDRKSVKPLSGQLYEGYRDAIVERRLRPGQRLPSTRSLATELRISRIPVLNAFEQLEAEGYLEGRHGSGTYVAGSLPDDLLTPARRPLSGEAPARRSPRGIARRAEALLPDQAGPWLKAPGPFSVGQPPLDRFPVRVWSKLVARHSRNADTNQLNYGNAMGLGSLREAVAEYLRTARAVRCEAAQIMIVNGSQQALELSSRVLLDPDSPVWIEEPGYWGARNVLRLVGARPVPVPVDEDGLDVAGGIARCPQARAAFVTPSHQFPLGVTMSASRRLQLLDWAQANGSWIVEDDYDSEYRYGSLPIASLQGLDRDSRVIYIGTFTKILFPALRLGYVVIPIDLVPAFVEVRRTMDFFSPTFSQAVLTDFIREGHFNRHIRRMRLLCRDRRDALAGSIRRELGGALRVLGDEAGMYLTANLPEGLRDREIALRAARDGLWTMPLSECYQAVTPRQGLILGYGGTSVAEIESAVSRLRITITGCARAPASTRLTGPITAIPHRADGQAPRSRRKHA
jgi:GntR family transcriptional regulator/MocR family aminotransferase